jgi:DNA (cytosine-5)-methyltransferase 1
VRTVKHNAARKLQHIWKWNVVQADVREMQWTSLFGQLALVSGGPPCQPFGIGGLKKGAEDTRDMWPEAIRAVREAAPTAFLFENVRNLAGPRFRPYLEWIELRLKHVGAMPSPTMEITERQISALKKSEAAYSTKYCVVNAADFGAPQIRYRVLLAGVANKLEVSPDRPQQTHSLEALLWDQWITGDYWRRHNLNMPSNGSIPLRHRATVERLRSEMIPPAFKAWITVRDALADLGEPNGKANHVYQAGARAYPGHTGSSLDLPAKALKAGDHGVPGGENMMVRDDGSVRYFTLREAARLVGLPDDYEFCRSWTESMRCLGNAVPVQLGEAAGKWVRKMLKNQRNSSGTVSRPRAMEDYMAA